MGNFLAWVREKIRISKVKRQAKDDRMIAWMTEESIWQEILDLTTDPSATIHLFDTRGEEVFRSPLRTEEVDGYRSFFSTEPVPCGIRFSKYEVHVGSGKRTCVVMTKGITPAGSPFRVEFRID
jgi:hypothetical protein